MYMSDEIITRVINTTDAIYYQVYELREAILRRPIGLSLADEDLSDDVKDVIIIAERNKEVLGCIMLKQTDDDRTIKFRQMAVKQNMQKHGIGKTIVKAAEAYAWQRGYDKIVLHARTTAEDFYKKFAYTTTSQVFTEVGIPHVMMEKSRPA